MLSGSTVSKMNCGVPTELVSRTSRKGRSKKWQCRVAETLVGEYLIVPLTSAKMLKSEAYMMNNCSREYTAQCAAMEYAVFSIRIRTGQRLATLGLSHEDGYWRFDQCFGPGNSEVLEETRGYLDDDGILQTEWFATELYFVAHEVVRLMNSPVNYN